MSFAKLAVFVTFFSFMSFSVSVAQDRISNLEGHWSWGLYADDKNELPPAYRDRLLSKVPEYSLELDIKQQGTKISGHYLCTWRFLSRIEEGDFTATVKGNKVFLNLESGFGGNVRVKLVRENDLLHWKVIKRKGDDYFHNNVTLSRTKLGMSNPEDAPDRKAVR